MITAVRTIRCVPIAAAAWLIQAGCLQIDTHILLQPDGSATVTERVRLSSQLLELDSNHGGQLAKLMEEPAVRERLKLMGPQVSLVRHVVGPTEKGWRECVTVCRVADLEGFTYVSPFLPRDGGRPPVAMKASFHAPLRDGSSWEYIAGWLGVRFEPVVDPKERRRPPATQEEPPPSPQQVQIVRDIAPLFADLMSDMHLKLTFESYAPILRASFGWRDARSATRKADLIDFAPGANNDMFGMPFLLNEEIMLDLLRWRLDSPVLLEHVKGWTTNVTLPAIHREGTIYFQPSMPLFKRFFEGKTLTHHRTGQVPARFEDIGYSPAASETAKPATQPASN